MPFYLRTEIGLSFQGIAKLYIDVPCSNIFCSIDSIDSGINYFRFLIDTSVCNLRSNWTSTVSYNNSITISLHPN